VNMSQEIRLAKGTSSHILEDAVLVFSEKAQALFRLNPTAAIIWSGLEQGLPPHEIAGELAEEFSILPDLTDADVGRAIAEWTTLGLLVSNAESDVAPERSLNWKDPVETGREFSGLSSTTRFPSRFAFTLAECGIAVRCSQPRQAGSVRPIFAHLVSEPRHVNAVIDVVYYQGSHVVVRGQRVVGRCSSLNEIGPLLSQEALRVAYRSRDFLVAVHAAVLGGRNGCIVLAGKSAVGKTTLAAGLMRAGFRFFTDEVAIVDRATGQVLPCPASLRVKDGSWDTIAGVWPNLKSVADTIAPAGFRIRYVAPVPGSFASGIDEASPVRHLVFPRYSPEASTDLVPMSRAEALEVLQETGCEMKGSLTSRTIADLVDWIKGINCYRMEVSSLSEAVPLIGGLLE